ncbi:FAD-binding oxidoreductase [uncultured Aeromicrobium sp.]|uniref:NAD(P)/FAD-dependent oxidoreductase n=1 Tax=uncultured Aeromicrobium sp. TaxID=337820 RepID=UPI0025CBBF56|nr:FAD-binding oxidoreductase [uncultured Aeromicrobium sp.]
MTAHDRALPTTADVVVIGGGIIGLSTAYHLARAGVEGVVLIERGSLGEGSTCKAAGGVRALFSDEINIALGQRSLETFERFAVDFDQEIDLHQVGYLLLADGNDTMVAFERNVEVMSGLGLEARLVDVAEAKRLSPLISTEGLTGGLFSPRDGHCTPESVVLGYTRAARRAGVKIFTGTAVTGIEVEERRVRAVQTTGGSIGTDAVVCAAGAWSQQIAAWAGEHLPIEPLRRQIVVTEPLDVPVAGTPFTIDFATSFYFHAEGRGLLLGAPEAKDCWGFDLTPDPTWLEHLAECIQQRVPSLEDVGIRSGWAGLYEMTPDHNAVIGRSESVEGFLYAAGFSGHGFLMGPAVGEVMRDLYLGATPVVDVSPLHASRFSAAAGRPELNII